MIASMPFRNGLSPEFPAMMTVEAVENSTSTETHMWSE